jgi:protein-tyrosine kinase
MLIPKASHLVERVTERLLRSGALEDSAAGLLRQPGAEAFVPDSGPGPSVPDSVDAIPISPVQRSSLFAPRPSNAKIPLPAQGLSGPPLVSDFGAPLPNHSTPQLDPVLPSAGILDQARVLDRAMTLERAADGSAPAPTSPAPTSPAPASQVSAPPSAPYVSRGFTADPAASLLQGPTSVDAVSLERAGMVDWSRTRTRISEEFRLVQRQIIRSAFGPGAEPGFSNLLLVTSARPGEGKSFMSTNLAGSIARQGDHHVLLVDADSKRDSICYSLGLAQARGLLDLAANPKLDPAPLIVKTPIERLSILSVGRERERSAELFSTKEMTRLIQSLGRRYADRLLILDAPPCLSTSDPAVLAQVVGQILFVVEADRTQRDEIEASLDLIQACPTITMVLNKQQISSRYTFGAYSSYYSS